MNRQMVWVAFFVAATATLAAQQASQTGPYEGVSNPPPDDTIVTTTTPKPKPSPVHRYAQAPAARPQPAAQPVTQPAPAATAPAPAPRALPGYRDGTDGGIVQVAPPAMQTGQAAPHYAQPELAPRDAAAADPDGDIVHPVVGPNELAEGTHIRVRLMQDLSSALNERGETFRTRVPADVLKDGRIMIPEGSIIEGRVAEASTGHFAGHGSLILQPEKVTFPNGASYPLRAMVINTPMSHTVMGAEGAINPGSRKKKNGIEYGGAVGTGAVAGAYLGGPAGALAGSLIGAGLVTTHILVSHPQTHLSEGDVLVLMLTRNLNLGPESARRD